MPSLTRHGHMSTARSSTHGGVMASLLKMPGARLAIRGKWVEVQAGTFRAGCAAAGVCQSGPAPHPGSGPAGWWSRLRTRHGLMVTRPSQPVNTLPGGDKRAPGC